MSIATSTDLAGAALPAAAPPSQAAGQWSKVNARALLEQRRARQQNAGGGPAAGLQGASLTSSPAAAVATRHQAPAGIPQEPRQSGTHQAVGLGPTGHSSTAFTATPAAERQQQQGGNAGSGINSLFAQMLKHQFEQRQLERQARPLVSVSEQPRNPETGEPIKKQRKEEEDIPAVPLPRFPSARPRQGTSSTSSVGCGGSATASASAPACAGGVGVAAGAVGEGEGEDQAAAVQAAARSGRWRDAAQALKGFASQVPARRLTAEEAKTHLDAPSMSFDFHNTGSAVFSEADEDEDGLEVTAPTHVDVRQAWLSNLRYQIASHVVSKMEKSEEEDKPRLQPAERPPPAARPAQQQQQPQPQLPFQPQPELAELEAEQPVQPAAVEPSVSEQTKRVDCEGSLQGACGVH